MNKIKTYKMPSEHTSDYGLGLRCCHKDIASYNYRLMTINLVGLIEFPENPEFKPVFAPAYVVECCSKDGSIGLYFLADEDYIFGINKYFHTLNQAIKHLKSICV